MDIKNNENSCFTQVSKRPAKFFLKDRIAGLVQYEGKQEKEKAGDRHEFKERDLHILLSSFVRVDEHFKCLTKTIYHEVSKRGRSGKNKWLHPDIPFRHSTAR